MTKETSHGLVDKFIQSIVAQCDATLYDYYYGCHTNLGYGSEWPV